MRRGKLFWRWLKIGLSVVIVYITTAVVFIIWPAPTVINTINDVQQATEALSAEPIHFTMRDEASLFAHYLPEPTAETVLLFLHGVMVNADYFAESAPQIQAEYPVEIYLLDLRGHGRSDGKRGDVAYDGQYEDDLADVITAVRRRHPQQTLILVGHSMGAGIILRHGQKYPAPYQADGYIFLSPYLGLTAPTVDIQHIILNSKNLANNTITIHWTRLAGLFMLNSIGLEQFNDYPFVFFYHRLTDGLGHYNFRVLSSAGPANHRAGLQTTAVPTLVLVGENDELFNPNRFQPLLTQHAPTTQFQLVNHATHDGLRNDPLTLGIMTNWLDSLFD